MDLIVARPTEPPDFERLGVVVVVGDNGFCSAADLAAVLAKKCSGLNRPAYGEFCSVGERAPCTPSPACRPDSFPVTPVVKRGDSKVTTPDTLRVTSSVFALKLVVARPAP